MDDVKFGEILEPGDEDTRTGREQAVREGFWMTLRRAAGKIPFARDVVAAYYCALDRDTPATARGVLLGALAYFVMPADLVPDVFAVVGFSDDVAVLTAAFAMIRGNLRPVHYERADKALAETG
ncbi:DUF1232 domain-containing protein [Martelella alba]|uniref:DUF1232 domain-containing protein n=1 Tax=Martelella alba TaxID=2590451 RepID=A0A506U2C1_9HYPH|nr:YkvA family protein [Martelella alba]TPW27526.1 DUF1232 domain-containing protein [Martelella alba]